MLVSLVVGVAVVVVPDDVELVLVSVVVEPVPLVLQDNGYLTDGFTTTNDKPHHQP